MPSSKILETILDNNKSKQDSPRTHFRCHAVFEILAGQTRNGQERHIFLNLSQQSGIGLHTAHIYTCMHAYTRAYVNVPTPPCTHTNTQKYIIQTNLVATFFAQEGLELGHDLIVPMVRG